MIGLPTETDEDLEELARLAEGILEAARRVGNRKAAVKVSVGPFVPKAWTPFQWEPFVPAEELSRRIALLRARFKRIRWAKLTWNEPEEAQLEALLSRGDRRFGEVIARAHNLGAVFDGWGECSRLDAWRQAIEEAGIDLHAELGPRDLTAVLPWDVIDAGVRKGFLKAERRRGFMEAETPDCRWGDCMRCGIPGDGLDTQLAPPTLPVAGGEAPALASAKNAAYRLRPLPRVFPAGGPLGQPERFARYRFTFQKLGDARWLSHRNVMDLLARALRAADLLEGHEHRRALEHLLHELEALAGRADHLDRRVGERQLRLGAARIQRFERRARHARTMQIGEHQRERAVAAAGQHEREVGHVAIGHRQLLAREAAALDAGMYARRIEIPGAFGHGQGSDELPGCEARQVFLLLLCAARQQQRFGGQIDRR